MTPDVSGTIGCSVDVLDFTCESASGGWVSLRRDDVVIMLSGLNEHAGATAPRSPARST